MLVVSEHERRAWLSILLTIFGGIMSGYFYLRMYRRGLFILGLLIAVIVVPFISIFTYGDIIDQMYDDKAYDLNILDDVLFSDIMPLVFAFVVAILGTISVVIFSIIDVYRLTVKHNKIHETRSDTIPEQIASKRVWLSVFLSIFGPGLGHWYVFQYKIGIILFVSTTVLYSIPDLVGGIITYVIFLSAALGVHVFSVINAYKITKQHNLKSISDN